MSKIYTRNRLLRTINNIKEAIFIIVFLVTFTVVTAALFFHIQIKQLPLTSPLPIVRESIMTTSIDTMKISRDLSQQELNDPTFDQTIDQQIAQIATTGATHVAIDTPYDSEFLPILKRWVLAARKYNLHVWFRGNWSGWEGWFGYSRIDRATHMQLTEDFIRNNSGLFVDGDIFTPCPECENGGPGDPRDHQDDLGAYRSFLIDEYTMTKNSFAKINKHVISNYDSMNADVAAFVMDPQTTQALDGIVVIDHYTKMPEDMVKKIDQIAKTSGGKVVLGEFGAPIPDLNGDMTEQQQAIWIDQSLKLMHQDKNLIGINYWTNVGGSTALWNDDGSQRAAVSVINNFYKTIKFAKAQNH